MKRILPLLLALVLLCMSEGIAMADAKYTQIDQETAKEMMAQDDGHVVVDVRRQDEYDEGHIPGAILIPNETIGCDSPEALPDYDQIILIYCRSGNRSKQAAEKLAGMGYTNIYEFGGINTWTGEIVTEEPVTNETATLRFSSFSGGGYEYTVEVEDSSVVSCNTQYEYEEQDEVIDGASYDFVVTFTGLKPGETTVRVYGRSPILENEDSIYTLTVDDQLNVSLEAVRAISTFFLYRSGDTDYATYQITMESDGYYVSVNEEEAFRIDSELADQLLAIIEEYDLAEWDGFAESKTGVMDGEGFWMEFSLTDGTNVLARGDNAYPEHYFEAIEPIQELLDGIEELNSEESES